MLMKVHRDLVSADGRTAVVIMRILLLFLLLSATQCDDVQIQHILNMKSLRGNVTLSWRNQSDGNVFQKHQQNKDTKHTCH
ncbi:hypothetical protein E1301_Tti020637s21 [Triplophysa tibetana]|uniref:Uncharacterized protein n=1 Tax=Triplophysa tibetana TaxID=1572043 RepID=A0A5A9PJC1_9TELE|nr:hypothetical protein E1301_Tti023311 [Triplophysa tibetana]KAA0721271.1 hypothetical protein E1301_Tti020637s21 [Triplophysa tibetana]